MLLLIKVAFNVINAMTGSITVAQNLPAYIIIQLSKSTRAFTCHSCVKSKYPLFFQKLHDVIKKIMMTPDSQSSSPKKHYPSDPISSTLSSICPTHTCCCCLPTPMTLASGGESDVPACGPPASFSVHLASSAVTPAGSVHKSRGDNVVRMWVQLKR